MKHSALAALLPVLVASACAQPAASMEIAESANTALALPSSFAFALQARASEDPFDPSGTFQLPVGSFIKDMTPAINASGDVALEFLAFDGKQHIWAKGHIVHDVPDPKAVVSGASINDAGDVAFDVMGADVGNGVFVYRLATGETSFFSSEPLGVTSWVSLRLTNNGRLGCRPSTGDARFIGYVEPEGFKRLAIETGANPNSPYQYLFSPSFDDHDHAASKVWLAAGGNEIRMFSPGVPARTLVQDREANAASPYTKLDNAPALNNVGQIAFIATENGRRGVFRTDGTTTARVAAEGSDEVREIGWFNPVINDAGLVAFKGEDVQGRHTIWLGDGTSLKRVITAGDTLPSDLGVARALPETGFDPNNRITFGGGLGMNAHGQIVFGAALARTKDGASRMGTGIYVATPVAR